MQFTSRMVHDNLGLYNRTIIIIINYKSYYNDCNNDNNDNDNNGNDNNNNDNNDNDTYQLFQQITLIIPDV